MSAGLPWIRWGKPRHRIEMFMGQSGVWFWRIVSAENGQTLSTSEAYSSFDKAEQTVLGLEKHCGIPYRVIAPSKLNAGDI